MQPPTLSNEQRSAASAKAVANRRRRAEVKDQIRSGELTWSDLLKLAESDDVVAAIQVREALMALPGVGPRRVERYMAHAKVSQTRRLRGLGERQLELLAEVLNQ